MDIVFLRMEEEYYWEERRRYQEEMEYYEWHRMGRPGMPPPRFGQLPPVSDIYVLSRRLFSSAYKKLSPYSTKNYFFLY